MLKSNLLIGAIPLRFTTLK